MMQDSKLVKFSDVTDVVQDAPVVKTRKRPPNAGKGRKKGIPNKVNKALKDMILGALSEVGGQNYLAEQAQINPGAFMQLIGKVLPTELKHQGEVGISVTITTGVPLDDAE